MSGKTHEKDTLILCTGVLGRDEMTALPWPQ